MKKIKNLVVSECFYSVQGEGQTMGVPAVFLRLAGCNLLCKSKSWVCDSIEVWKKGIKTDFKDVLKCVNSQYDYTQRLRQGAHLVITGGEPMLHQLNVINYLKWFEEENGFKPIIEIETNGTILPYRELYMKVNYWNVSPKLSNSGEPFEKRFKRQVLQFMNELSVNSIFKFVIETKEDALEMINEYGPYVDMKKVMFMPAGETQEKLNQTRPIVLEICKNLSIRYTDRLHIVAWNLKTGV